MPEVTPIAESGVPGFDTASWVGLVSPRGTPPAVIARLNAEIAAAIRGGDLRDQLASQGFVPQASTPPQFAAHVSQELGRFRKLVRAANIREQ
jgi:tripartite-type tricarboxylate transporter receptor subunit TctC